MLATNRVTGVLNPIKNCYITVGSEQIPLNILPDISDGKAALYNDEPIPGRSYPIKTFSRGDNRSINLTVYFYADSQEALTNNIKYCYLLRSAVHPRDKTQNGLPYMPPPICTFRCSGLMSNCALCVVLKNYDLKIPRDVQWDESTMCPYYFTMGLSLDVVYDNLELPGQEKVFGELNDGCNPISSSSSSSSGTFNAGGSSQAGGV